MPRLNFDSTPYHPSIWDETGEEDHEPGARIETRASGLRGIEFMIYRPGLGEQTSLVVSRSEAAAIARRLLDLIARSEIAEANR